MLSDRTLLTMVFVVTATNMLDAVSMVSMPVSARPSRRSLGAGRRTSIQMRGSRIRMPIEHQP